MRFKNADTLKKHIEVAVRKALKNEVTWAIRDAESNKVHEVVYDAYSPNVYERREDLGGLSYPGNMKSKISGTTLCISNVTPPNNTVFRNDFCYPRTVNNLTALVEYGDGGAGGEYTHKHAGAYDPLFLAPRPFIASTRSELAQSKQHVDAMADGLSNLGFKVNRL